MTETKSQYEKLQHFVCVEWGFCGSIKDDLPFHVDYIIPDSGPVTADQFVEWVFLADNINPNSNPDKWGRHKVAIREAFLKYMGNDVVDASKLKWR